jgi:plasmid stabilization system protein ParE
MQLKWTASAVTDIARLHDFLAPLNSTAAAKTVQMLTHAPSGLLSHPLIGRLLEEFAPKQIRRIIVGQYEIRYEIIDSTIYILRVWHTRENR